MRRFAAILLIALALVAPVAADLTITTVMTIEGAMMTAAQSGLTPKVLIRISGTKSRVDVETGDQVITTLADTATNQGYLLRPDEKTALLVPLDAPGSAGSPLVAPKIDLAVTPTGQKREIEGVACEGYDVLMKLDLASIAAGSGAALPPEAATMLKDVTMTISGSVWAARDAPGAAEYSAFQKSALRLTTAAGQSSIPAGMDRLLTGFAEAQGIPYLTEFTTKLEGAGQLVALMQQMGQMKITSRISSVSTDALSADIFTIPEGYTVVK